MRDYANTHRSLFTIAAPWTQDVEGLLITASHRRPERQYLRAKRKPSNGYFGNLAAMSLDKGDV